MPLPHLPGSAAEGHPLRAGRPGHISRTTLYSFEETLALAARLKAKKTVFMHLEEHWHRSYDDYCRLEREIPGIAFSYDGMKLTTPE